MSRTGSELRACHQIVSKPHRVAESRSVDRTDTLPTPSFVKVAWKSVVRSGEIKALTGLRIIAAVWVVLFHFRPMLSDASPGFRDALSPVLNCGAQGVDLFFMLSGFVLT